jgi:hypothetical protein
VPPNLSWDLWLGPAPVRPFWRRLLSVRVAWVLGFRLGRARRHGLPGELRKDKDGKEEQLPFTLANRGVLVIGDKEKLYASGDACDSGGMLTTGRVPDDVKFERSPGHFAELVWAIRGGPPAVSNFPDYAGPLTEAGLVGNLAIWLATTADEPGKKLDWDPVALVARNASELEPLIRP